MIMVLQKTIFITSSDVYPLSFNGFELKELISHNERKFTLT